MTRCPNYDAPYCMEHDYDHVLERREAEEVGLPSFGYDEQEAYWDREFAAREAAQERDAYRAELERELEWERRWS